MMHKLGTIWKETVESYFGGLLEKIKFKEEISEMLHNMEHSVVWCSNLDTSESRSKILGKICNVVLEKDGED